jgi:hypothetical protein
MKVQRIVVIVVLLICASCARKSANVTDRTSYPGPVAKVRITSEGIIYLNGNKVSIEETKKTFIQLKAEKGSVWYYRDNPQGEPTREAMAVIEVIADAKLPVRLCSTEHELNESP